MPRARRDNPLRILLVVIPVILLMAAALHFGPGVMSRYAKPQRVWFSSPEWFFFQNTSGTNWIGGEAVINGEHRVRFDRVLKGEVVKVDYRQFTNGLTLRDVRRLEIKPDGHVSMTHIPER